MNKLLTISILLAITLASCGNSGKSTAETKPPTTLAPTTTTTSTTSTTTTAPTTTTEAPPLTTPIADILTEVRKAPGLADQSDATLISMLHIVCGELNSGSNIQQVVDEMNSGFGAVIDNGASSGRLLVGAVFAYCPTHKAMVQAYIGG